MQIRRFSPDLRRKIPGNHPGLYGVPIQMPRALLSPEKQEAFARRVNGMPLLLDAALQVEVMYFDPHASMEEHAADHLILFLVYPRSGNGAYWWPYGGNVQGPVGRCRTLACSCGPHGLDGG